MVQSYGSSVSEPMDEDRAEEVLRDPKVTKAAASPAVETPS